MNYEAVYNTAPATPGLLNILGRIQDYISPKEPIKQRGGIKLEYGGY